MDYQKYIDLAQQTWQRWQNRPQTNLTPLWATIIIVVLLGNSALVYFNFFYSPKPDNEEVVKEEVVDGTKMVSSLTGLEISEEDSSVLPVAVMLDNFPPARPQHGISKADIVWETVVEGGVTRLLAIFATGEDVVIGPVRSAREYYLPLASGLSALYAHSGGSPAALEALKKGWIFDGDEFKYASSYYRSRLRTAPHNLFTTTNRLQDLIDESLASEWGMLSQLNFDSEDLEGDVAEEVIVNFSLPEYRVRWSYDNEANNYRRFVGGDLVYDGETEDVVTANNVVILFTEVRPTLRPNYPDALYVETVGSGEALFIRNGAAVDGEWSISGPGRVIFTHTSGEPYGLSPGNTWIQIVSADIPGNVSIK